MKPKKKVKRETIAQKALRLLNPLPYNRWTTGSLFDGYNSKDPNCKKCLMWHFYYLVCGDAGKNKKCWKDCSKKWTKKKIICLKFLED